MVLLRSLVRDMPAPPAQSLQRDQSLQSRASYHHWLRLGVMALLLQVTVLALLQTAAARPRQGTQLHRSTALHRRVRRSPHRGCWVDIFAGPDFAAPTRHIVGPINLPNLRLSDKNWGDAINSIKTGPRTWVRVYKDTSYRGEYLTIHPNSAHRSLRPLKFKDSIDSMIVRNHPF